MANAISIDETNKIRKSLGLPLLPVPGSGPVFKDASSDSDSEEEVGSTLASREAQAFDNFKRVQDEQKDKVAREVRKDAVRKAKELAAREARLEGKGLGEADDEEQDTRAWLMSQKKRQRKIEKERSKAQRLDDELKAREYASYTSRDLAGVRVAHELNEFQDENQHVLVLKDATIDENEEEGDELENVDLREQERRDERLDSKKRKPVYNPNDDEGDGDGGFLKQYDEAIGGKKRKRFTLDTNGRTAEQNQASTAISSEGIKKQAVSLDILKELPQSDYVEPKEIKIRKSKKQKKSSRRKADDDDDLLGASINERVANGEDSMEIEAAPTQTVRSKSALVIDDDDLQASLAKKRRDALKKRKKTRPEDLARQVRDETFNSMQEDETEDDDNGLVIDETSFFVSNIDERQREIEAGREADARRQAKMQINDNAQESNHFDNNGNEDEDVKMNDDHHDDDAPAIKTEEDGPSQETSTGTGLDVDSDFNKGLGSVFSFLKGRGMWDASETSTANEDTRNAQMFRSQKRRLEAESDAKARAQRLAGREAGRYAGHSQRDREEFYRKENEMRQQQDSLKLADLYSKTYQPSFELKYHDEFGREMDQKEAFKHLSHQFHGKGSGKMKTEKHLKRIEDEQKNASKSLMDNSQMSNYSNAADATAKRRGTVGVQLGK